MLASLTGVISVWKQFGRIIEKNLHFLVSFSAGVFLFVSYQLGNEAIEHARTVSAGLIWVVVGIFGFWLIFKLLPAFHHHHDNDQEIHVHSPIDARKIIVSDAIHNVGDGVLLASSFAINITLGIVATISIFIHEVVQETSQFFVLRGAGFSTKKALLTNLATSGTILLGSLGAYFLMASFEAMEVPLLGLASGSFLMVVIQDLIPHSIRNSTTKIHIIKHLAWFSIGLILMIIVGAVFSH
jgi:zinc and cadmium transporter